METTNSVTENVGQGSEAPAQGGVTVNAGEGQPEGGAPRDAALGAAPAAEAAASPTATEPGGLAEYEAFALPDGMDPRDAGVSAALDEAKGVFRELGLNQQQAQKLIDLHMKHYIGGVADENERFEREVDRRVEAWGRLVKTDPEVGGAKLEESRASARRAIANLGGDALHKALTDETGIINHPEVFKAFARMGRYFSEDKFVAGSNAGASDNSPSGMAARVYPNMRRG